MAWVESRGRTPQAITTNLGGRVDLLLQASVLVLECTQLLGQRVLHGLSVAGCFLVAQFDEERKALLHGRFQRGRRVHHRLCVGLALLHHHLDLGLRARTATPDHGAAGPASPRYTPPTCARCGGAARLT